MQTVTSSLPTSERPIVAQESPSSLSVASTPTSAPVRSLVLAFTGRLKIGKDFVAKASGAEIHHFADPLYKLCQFFFGSVDKDLAGMRQTMQVLGQWGRGITSEGYQLSVPRGVANVLIRAHGENMAPGMEVEWPNYGIEENIWLDALFRRLVKSVAPVKAITGLRFANEYKRCKAEGCRLIHVMASPETYAQRLRDAGMAIDHPALRDQSELLALSIDAQYRQAWTKDPNGPKLTCVWSDPNLPPPSRRLLTVDDFRAKVTEWIAQ